MNPRRGHFHNPDLLILIAALSLISIVWFPLAARLHVPRPLAFTAIPIGYAITFWHNTRK